MVLSRRYGVSVDGIHSCLASKRFGTSYTYKLVNVDWEPWPTMWGWLTSDADTVATWDIA